MSATPYSDAWREHTKARMRRLGIDVVALWDLTGLDVRDFTCALVQCGPVSIEIAGPIDEHLGQLEASAEAKAVKHGPRRGPRVGDRAMTVPGRGALVPVAVDLDALTDCDVVLHGRAAPR